MVSLFPLLFLIGYRSTGCIVCSRHNGLIQNKCLKKVNIVHMKYGNIVTVEVKVWDARMNHKKSVNLDLLGINTNLT